MIAAVLEEAGAPSEGLRERPEGLAGTILSLIPGCQPDAWMSDYAMPERAVAPEEQVWSNIMDAASAAKFLDEQT